MNSGLDVHICPLIEKPFPDDQVMQPVMQPSDPSTRQGVNIDGLTLMWF